MAIPVKYCSLPHTWSYLAVPVQYCSYLVIPVSYLVTPGHTCLDFSYLHHTWSYTCPSFCLIPGHTCLKLLILAPYLVIPVQYCSIHGHTSPIHNHTCAYLPHTWSNTVRICSYQVIPVMPHLNHTAKCCPIFGVIQVSYLVIPAPTCFVPGHTCPILFIPAPYLVIFGHTCCIPWSYVFIPCHTFSYLVIPVSYLVNTAHTWLYQITPAHTWSYQFHSWSYLVIPVLILDQYC